jgi:hypothetical protein
LRAQAWGWYATGYKVFILPSDFSLEESCLIIYGAIEELSLETGFFVLALIDNQ